MVNICGARLFFKDSFLDYKIKKEYMISLIFDIILFILICLCLWRLADIKHRLEMNIIVVQSLQFQLDTLEKNNDAN
jgi:hypothetical protein